MVIETRACGIEACGGLSFDIPLVGFAGAVLDLGIDGNAGSLTLKVGVDACIDLPIVGRYS